MMRRLLSSSSGSEVQSQLTFGLEKSFAVAELDVNPDVAVLPVGLDEQHAVRARRGQAMRQHAAGAAGADDDVVERFCLSPHGLPPYANASRPVMFYRRMTERTGPWRPWLLGWLLALLRQRPLDAAVRAGPDQRHEHVDPTRDPLIQERRRNGDGIKEWRQLAFEVPADGGGQQ